MSLRRLAAAFPAFQLCSRPALSHPGPAHHFQVNQGWQGDRPCLGWGHDAIPSPLSSFPFVPSPLPWAFPGQERAKTSRWWRSRVLAVSGGVLAGLVASVKISLWWSVGQSLPAPDSAWEHKSPRLAQFSRSDSRSACPRPQAHSGLLPRQAPAQDSGPGPPSPRRHAPPPRIKWAGDGGRPSPGLGQPHPRHPRGSKYYITTGCAVRDLRQAPGLKFPEMEFAYCSPHPKNSIKKNNRKNVVRRGPARAVYLAAAVPLRSGGNWFCIARGNWQKNKSAGSRSRDAAGRGV